MKYNLILILLTFCILSTDAPPRTFMQRCAHFAEIAVRAFTIGYVLNPELKDCLHDVTFLDFNLVRDQKNENYPRCSDYKSIRFHFPAEGDPYANVVVACTENRLGQMTNVKHRFMDGKTMLGVKRDELQSAYMFGIKPVTMLNVSGSSCAAHEQVKFYKEKVKAIGTKFIREMVFALIFLDEHEFQYAIFQTLDKECAWIGWRAGIRRPHLVPDQIKEFLKRNGIAFLNHGEASTSGY